MASGASQPPPPRRSIPPLDGERGMAAVAVFLVLLLASLAGFAYVFWGFLTDVILALLFTVLSLPVYTRLSKAGVRDWMSASVVCLLITILVALPLTFLIFSLSQEAAAAYESSREMVTPDRIKDYLFGEGWLAKNARALSLRFGFEYTPDAVVAAVSSIAGAAAKAVGGQLNTLIANLLSAAYHFLVILLIVFYGLIDGDKAKAFLLRLSPLPAEDHEIVGDMFRNVGKAILFGNGLGSIIQGVLGAIAMVVAGLPSATLWGTIMAIFAFLPLVGISVVTIPATLYLGLVEGRWLAAIVFFGGTTAVALFVENVVKTRLIGSHMKMHNLLIFLSILGGLSVFGIIGILYGPLVVALFLTFAELYERGYQQKVPGASHLGPAA